MKLTKGQRRELRRILVAGGIFAALIGLMSFGWIPALWYVRLPLFLIPYFLVGWDIWRKAVSNAAHGQLLDENFLMCIATVGALVLAEYPEAVFVMLFYQVGELFQSIAVGKSRRSIAELMEIRPDEARVVRNGVELILSPDEVEVGEIILVRPGERIPLDGTVIKGGSELNTVSLTGEAFPRAVREGDEAVSGCVNLTSPLWLSVRKPFSESTVSKILELVENSALVKSKAERAVTKFAHWYTPCVVLLAALLALIPSFLTGDWQRWLHTALIFLVVSCPCALVISIPLSYFGGLGCASRHGVLVKGANWLEALAEIDTVVFDKTGTLTEGCFCLSAVQTADGGDRATLLRLCAASEQNSNHPIAHAFLDAWSREGKDALPSAEISELAGLGICAEIEGGRILLGNAVLMRAEGISFPESDAAAGSVIYVAADGKWIGTAVISDQIKQSTASAISRLRENGVRRIAMLSGDREASARAVAMQLGLDTYRAELLPQDKVACIESFLQEKRGTLAFVGDGINDAPVLARADVGIAMGVMGADAAIEAADVVLMDDDPAKIADAVAIARFTRRIVLQNTVFALGIKLLFLALSVLDRTNMWAATFADVGVAVIAILNSMRTLRYRSIR